MVPRCSLVGNLFAQIGPAAVYPMIFAFSGTVNLTNFAWTYITKVAFALASADDSTVKHLLSFSFRCGFSSL